MRRRRRRSGDGRTYGRDASSRDRGWGEPGRLEHPARGRPAADPLFSRQCRRARPAGRALSRHGEGGHGGAGDRISRLCQLNRLAKRGRTQARRRSGLCGGDRERRRGRSASSPSGSRSGPASRSRSPRATRSARWCSNSPYSSIADVAAAAYWFVPVRALLRDPFRNDLLIGPVTAPTLMVHGTKDPVVPDPLRRETVRARQSAEGVLARRGRRPSGAGRAPRRDPRLDRPNGRVIAAAVRADERRLARSARNCVACRTSASAMHPAPVSGPPTMRAAAPTSAPRRHGLAQARAWRDALR